MRNWRNCNGRSKVKTNNNDLESAIILQYFRLKWSWRNQRFPKTNPCSPISWGQTCSWFQTSLLNLDHRYLCWPPVKWMKYIVVWAKKSMNRLFDSLPIGKSRTTNIADFSKDGTGPYFMEDTIHKDEWLLALIKRLSSFVTKAEIAPTYHLNDRFFSASAWP